MLTLIGRRLVQLIPTLFFVSVIIFSLQQLLPGDPALVMAGEEKDPEVIEQIRRQYRLDQPVPIQYLYWIKGVFTGDLGESMRLKAPVLQLILQKLPVTLQLATMAMAIALLIGVTAGVVSAVKRDTWIDYAKGTFTFQRLYKGRTVERSGTIDAGMSDILSSFFYTRTLPLELGKSYEMTVFSDEKPYDLKVTVHPKLEKVTVPAGKFECIRIDPNIIGDAIFKAKEGKMSIWMTNDNRRMPVLIRSRVFIGAFDAELAEATGTLEKK